MITQINLTNNKFVFHFIKTGPMWFASTAIIAVWFKKDHLGHVALEKKKI